LVRWGHRVANPRAGLSLPYKQTDLLGLPKPGNSQGAKKLSKSLDILDIEWTMVVRTSLSLYPESYSYLTKISLGFSCSCNLFSMLRLGRSYLQGKLEQLETVFLALLAVYEAPHPRQEGFSPAGTQTPLETTEKVVADPSATWDATLAHRSLLYSLVELNIHLP